MKLEITRYLININMLGRSDPDRTSAFCLAADFASPHHGGRLIKISSMGERQILPAEGILPEPGIVLHRELDAPSDRFPRARNRADGKQVIAVGEEPEGEPRSRLPPFTLSRVRFCTFPSGLRTWSTGWNFAFLACYRLLFTDTYLQ